MQNGAMELRDIESCLPPRLHTFSRQVLEFYLHGHMTTEEFRRWFHMPNSDYLMLGDCIAQKVDPLAQPVEHASGFFQARHFGSAHNTFIQAKGWQEPSQRSGRG